MAASACRRCSQASSSSEFSSTGIFLTALHVAGGWFNLASWKCNLIGCSRIKSTLKLNWIICCWLIEIASAVNFDKLLVKFWLFEALSFIELAPSFVQPDGRKKWHKICVDEKQLKIGSSCSKHFVLIWTSAVLDLMKASKWVNYSTESLNLWIASVISMQAHINDFHCSLALFGHEGKTVF